MKYHITQGDRPFARTNRQTIHQRASILQELGYKGASIAEICCGDCRRQHDIYQAALMPSRFCGLDLSPSVVALNLSSGVSCRLGDALNEQAMHPFLSFDVLFFGPPLSEHCDGHTGLSFQKITPGFKPFCNLLFSELNYRGLLVCIGPKSTNLGDIRWLYEHVRLVRPDVGLRLIHYSYATLTGNDVQTEARLKYVELWLGAGLDDSWEIRGKKE